MPDLSSVQWRLSIGGAVAQPVELSMQELRSLPAVEFAATMECAGNGRTGFSPLPQGEPWGLGALGTAVWKGVPLVRVLQRAGVAGNTVEVLFEGADRGVPSPGKDEVPFARSLPLEKALHPDTLLAYEMNGQPLSPQHGGPMRLVVPGWYGMASVKWLATITVLEWPFTGFYQRDRYVLDLPGVAGIEPVRAMQVRALITSHITGMVVPAGSHTVSGAAWSGEGSIASVEVAVEGGGPWQQATLVGQAAPYAWQQWEFSWQPSRIGRHVLRARAADDKGNVQPDLAPWNRLGYCNNSVQPVLIDVLD